MAKNCSLCGRVRAQRPCPALGEDVCSLCCGKGRRRTIACPKECRYLEQARDRAFAKIAALAGDYTMETDWADIVHNLRRVLVAARQKLARDLTNRECLEAAENALGTLSTKTKGLIYEYKSPNQRVQLLADELGLVVSAHLAGQKGLRRVRVEEALRALRYLRRQLGEAEKRNVDYVDLVGQYVSDRHWGDEKPEGELHRPILYGAERSVPPDE